jgi:hypothetical protein
MERNTVTLRIGNFRKQEMRDEEKRSEQCRRRAGPRGRRGGATPGLSFEGGDARKWGGKDKTYHDRTWSSARARRRGVCGLKRERDTYSSATLDVG